MDECIIWSPFLRTQLPQTCLLLIFIFPLIIAFSQYQGGQALNSLTRVASSSLPIHLCLAQVVQTCGQGCTNLKGQMWRQFGLCSSQSFYMFVVYKLQKQFGLRLLGKQLPYLFNNFITQMKSNTPKLATVTHHNNSPIQYSEETEPELPLSPEVKNIIRRKVSSYINCQISKGINLSKQITINKKSKPLPKQFGEYSTLQELLRDEKNVFHLYKEKIDRNMDECLYFYLHLLCLAIDYQCRVSQKEIDEESSLIIEAFLFVSSSLLEAGAEKAGFYFATIAITFCEYYKALHPIGEFLFIMAKISRKLFKYKESLVLLKKALEYNWWTDAKRVDKLNSDFRRWILNNTPQEFPTFDEKYEIGRIFHTDNGYLSHRTHKVDSELKLYKDLLAQFFESTKIRHEHLQYDVVHKRTRSIDQRAIDLELEIYNEMSFNFLQLNKKEESKLFAEKYQSGYTEPEGSKIITLSHELINSIQKRVTGWHSMNAKNFELLFFLDIFELVRVQRGRMRNMDQQVVLSCFKIIFQNLSDNFLTKQIFSYEIPLPLELKRDIVRTKKRRDGKKFIIRQRSSSHAAKQHVEVIKKYSSDKVQENLIFNYRGLKISRLKLLDIYDRFMDRVKEVEAQGSFKVISWRL